MGFGFGVAPRVELINTLPRKVALKWNALLFTPTSQRELHQLAVCTNMYIETRENFKSD